MRNLKNYFYDSFSKYKTEAYDERKSSVIRMVYLTINEGLMNKVRYGSGSHPWEDINSPTQMICEEVLSEIIIGNMQNKSYCQILKENSIESKSWSYVYVCNTDLNKAKLEISNKYKFPSFKAKNIMAYIKVCHFLPSILVQSVLARYKINPSSWKRVDYSDYYNVIDNVMKDVEL
jgi:hypothetical protein